METHSHPHCIRLLRNSCHYVRRAVSYLFFFSLDESNVEKGPCGEAINCSGSQRRVPGPFKRLQDIEAGPGSVRLGGLRQPPVSTHTPITMEGFAPWQRPSPLSKAPSPEPAGPRPLQAAGRCEETRWAALGSSSVAVPSMGQDASSRWLWGCGAVGTSPRSLVPGSRPASCQGCCRAQQQGPHAQAAGRGHRSAPRGAAGPGATARHRPGARHGPTPRAQASRRALQLPNLIGPISAYDKNLRMDFSLAEEGMIWSAAQFYEPYGCPS